MICDTTFLSDLVREREKRQRGPAEEFLCAHRQRPLWVTPINIAELAEWSADEHRVRSFLSAYRQMRFNPEMAFLAARIQRSLAQRLGENDCWIAAFCLYNQQPLISRDLAFDRVRGLRRLRY